MENNAPQRPHLPKLFEVKCSANELILTANSSLNDASWGAWFGEIQKILRNKKQGKQAFTQCHVDLEPCGWADPLPLLSLSLALIEYEQDGGEVRITLPPAPPTPDKNNPVLQTAEQENQTRLLKFLAREGFLELLARSKAIIPPATSPSQESNTREIKLGKELVCDASKEAVKLRELSVTLAFERSTCLRATILDLSAQKNTNPLAAVDKWVEEILFRDIAPVINDNVPAWAQDDLRYRLMTFLRETLHNIVEHAEIKFAAVYVRYREGAFGESPETWKNISPFTKREENKNNVPLMGNFDKSPSFPNTRAGFFEVFVIDAGQGLCRSLAESNKPKPVQKTMLDVFKHGKSSKKNRSTQYGGLYLIGQLLTPNEDYFRARDEDAWWATQLPLKDEQKAEWPEVDSYGKGHGNDGIRGLAWTARLSWLDAQDVSNLSTLWRGIRNKEERNDLLRVYENYVDEKKFDDMLSIPVYDARFQPPYQHYPTLFTDNDQALLFLPQPKLMKSHIQDKIQDEIKRLLRLLNKCAPMVENLSLVIGDIPSEEAITYVAATNKAYKFKEPVFKAMKRVVLITRALKVCILERDKSDQLLTVSETEIETYLSSNKPTGTSLHRNLFDYLCILRKYDGHRLRSMITEQPEYMEFLAEEVDWHDGKTIKGYLDFPQTLTNPLFRAIYSLSLQRLAGLFPGRDCRMDGLDLLTDSLVTRFKAQIHPRPALKNQPRESHKIQIGSIRVSGYTEKMEKLPDTTVFYFFRHPDSQSSGRFLLPWIGTTTIKESSTPQFRRVGKTPVIARDGWKAYPLPRYSKDISVYEKNPRDSYRAWQEPGRNPMKLGHWSYGGHHEILTINLLLAFDTDLGSINLIQGGSLAGFVYANFFRVFGIKKKDLNTPHNLLFDKLKNDNYQHLLPVDIRTKKPLLVYSSHPVTDHIIDRFLDLLTLEAMKRVRSRLVAILPIRRRRMGSGLQISGLTLERLKKFTTKETTPVVFFDDAAISGRTYEEIKRLLKDIGYQTIYSLILLDRQRLPSTDYLENGSKHVCYWRLDVPSLGGRSHCPLCHAIDRVTALSDSIVSRAHKERIDSWCQSWKELDPSTEWGSTGLRPIPLTLKNPEKKFGIVRNLDGTYRQIGGEKNQIRLTNSAGLIAWVSELHTITSRDDLVLSLLKKEGEKAESLPPDVRIQLLSSQLLLFFAEFDPEHAQDLGIALMEALWKSEKHGRHTALAVLTLIGCGDEFLKDVMDKFLDSKRLPELRNKNIDFVLLTALKLVVERRESGELKQDSNYDVVTRLLKPCGKKTDLYYRLHREIKDALGIAHSSPLYRILQSPKSLPSESLMNGLGSAAQIVTLVDAIPSHSLRNNPNADKNYTTIKSKIERLEKKLIKEISSIIDKSPASSYNKVHKIAKLLLARGNKLHEGLFATLDVHGGKAEILSQFSIPFTDNFNGKDDKAPRVIKWHSPGNHYTQTCCGELRKKNDNFAEAFVVWDTDVIRAVRDILSNVRHVTQEDYIVCPWNNDQGLKAHLWCRIQMDNRWLQIEMKNKCTETAKGITEDTKCSHSRHIIEEIGGTVIYTKPDDLLLTTIISLPYAHTLHTLSKENSNA